jgi:pyridoxamine 5'-phosphate oxidase
MKDDLRTIKSLAGPLPDFDIAHAPEDPRELFVEWLRRAIEANVREPHAMTLSTVDDEGRPDARVLILKNVDDRGWHFATTSTGPKGRQLARAPYAALTFYWPALGRQIRIRGKVIYASTEESAEDFRERSAGARAIALTTRQSDVLTSRDCLDGAIVAQAARLDRDPGTAAPHWSLFTVIADEIEFWQGREDRRHQRLRYRRQNENWISEELWP